MSERYSIANDIEDKNIEIEFNNNYCVKFNFIKVESKSDFMHVSVNKGKSIDGRLQWIDIKYADDDKNFGFSDRPRDLFRREYDANDAGLSEFIEYCYFNFHLSFNSFGMLFFDIQILSRFFRKNAPEVPVDV